MHKPYRMGNLLALGAIAILPACSMFGGNHNRTASQPYDQSTYNQQANAAQMPAPSSVPPGAAVAPISRDTISQVQQKLAQDGEYRGRVDGVWGPRTERAVRDYQSKNSLNASGMLDAATLQSMDITSNNPNGNANNNPNYNATNNPNYNTSPNAGPGTAPSQATNTPGPADQGNPGPNNNPNPNAPAGTRTP